MGCVKKRWLARFVRRGQGKYEKMTSRYYLSSPLDRAHRQKQRKPGRALSITEKVGFVSMDDLVEALNHLLEAERAAVEALVKLSVFAADTLERESLQRIGADEAWACASLRGQIEMLGGIPSRSISPMLTPVREKAQFAAGVQAFCHHQRGVLKELEALLALPLPAEVRGLLVELQRVHLPNVVWCEEHAAFTQPGKRPAGNSGLGGEKPRRRQQKTEHLRKGQGDQSAASRGPISARYAPRARHTRATGGETDAQGR